MCVVMNITRSKDTIEMIDDVNTYPVLQITTPQNAPHIFVVDIIQDGANITYLPHDNMHVRDNVKK